MLDKLQNTINLNRRSILIGGLIVIAFAGGTVFGSAFTIHLAQAQTPSAADNKLFQPFWQAWTLMHENYVDPLDDHKLMTGALNGMMNAVNDPYTNYFDPASFKATSDQLAGQITGIGAPVEKDDKTGALKILSTYDNSPAREAGLLPGDLVVTVDNQDITKLDTNATISKVRGPAGSIVILGILRGSSTKPLMISITRRVIALKDVRTVLYTGDIGYISLAEFGRNASADLQEGLKKLNANHLKGLILDLRGNPGGYVTAAINVASQFLPAGDVFIEKGRNGSTIENKVTGSPFAPNVPMVVLVDAGSASASEIVSGALQDAGRAIVVGTKTYGKGSEQIISPLNNGGAAHITIARWFTPNGRTIQTTGLIPDITVPYTPTPTGNTPDAQLQEALLVLRGEF